jgi:DMSO/TMAO reductase YedYZ heme-binding membrane subunit
LAVTVAWVGIFFVNGAGGSMNWREAIDQTGTLTWVLLVFIIFISLLHKHFPQIPLFLQLLPLRKHAGIFAFLILVSHFVGQFIRSNVFGNPHAMIAEAFSTKYAMVFGSVSFLILLPIFLTSTLWAVKHMGFRSWKNLQRFTHVAFVFAALHIALLRFFYNGSIEVGPIILLALYATGYALLFLRKKPNISH